MNRLCRNTLIGSVVLALSGCNLVNIGGGNNGSTPTPTPCTPFTAQTYANSLRSASQKLRLAPADPADLQAILAADSCTVDAVYNSIIDRYFDNPATVPINGSDNRNLQCPGGGGSCSELTAAMQYFYRSMFLMGGTPNDVNGNAVNDELPPNMATYLLLNHGPVTDLLSAQYCVDSNLTKILPTPAFTPTFTKDGNGNNLTSSGDNTGCDNGLQPGQMAGVISEHPFLDKFGLQNSLNFRRISVIHQIFSCGIYPDNDDPIRVNQTNLPASPCNPTMQNCKNAWPTNTTLDPANPFPDPSMIGPCLAGTTKFGNVFNGANAIGALWKANDNTIVVGSMVISPTTGTGSNTQQWMATAVSGATGGTEPSWPASPTTGTWCGGVLGGFTNGCTPGTCTGCSTITDGGVTWTYVSGCNPDSPDRISMKYQSKLAGTSGAYCWQCHGHLTWRRRVLTAFTPEGYLNPARTISHTGKYTNGGATPTSEDDVEYPMANGGSDYCGAITGSTAAEILDGSAFDCKNGGVGPGYYFGKQINTIQDLGGAILDRQLTNDRFYNCMTTRHYDFALGKTQGVLGMQAAQGSPPASMDPTILGKYKAIYDNGGMWDTKELLRSIFKGPEFLSANQ